MPVFPALPDNHSPFPWHFSTAGGGPVFDMWIDVLGDIPWTRPEQSRTAQGACGGPPLTLSASPGALPYRTFKVVLRFPYSPQRETRMAALEQAWLARGPYYVAAACLPNTQPLVLRFDPSQGALSWVTDGAGGRRATVGLQETVL